MTGGKSLDDSCLVPTLTIYTRVLIVRGQQHRVAGSTVRSYGMRSLNCVVEFLAAGAG